MKQEPTPPEPKPEGQGAGAPETPPTLMVLLVDSPVAEHDEQRAERTARASRQCDVILSGRQPRELVPLNSRTSIAPPPFAVTAITSCGA
jgi:hypothetical protein